LPILIFPKLKSITGSLDIIAIETPTGPKVITSEIDIHAFVNKFNYNKFVKSFSPGYCIISAKLGFIISNGLRTPTVAGVSELVTFLRNLKKISVKKSKKWRENNGYPIYKTG